MKRNENNKSIMKCSKGFTLVELIVVLVILTILAAILTPVLIGYIDKAREQQGLIEAEYYVTAIQTELTELYAKEGGSKKIGESVIAGNPNKLINNNNGDINATSTVFSKKVFALMEKESEPEPYCLVAGLGSNASDEAYPGANDKTTLHDKYKVYFLFYMKTADSTPWFYFNGQWSHTYPRANANDDTLMSKSNVIQGGLLKGKRLQLYCFANGAYKDHGTYGKTPFWEWVRSYQ